MLERKTLGELGATLPVGTFHNNEFHKRLAVRKWRMEEERELGKLRKEGEQTAALYASVVLGYMLTKFGIHEDFQALSEGERRLAINQAPLADILYAWVWMRAHCLDSGLGVSLMCPACRHKFNWTGDLNSMDVDVLTDVEDLAVEHTLRDGIEVGKSEIHKITISPPLWATYEAVRRDSAGDMAMGDMKRLLLRSAIRGTPEVKALQFTEEHLDGLTKYDIERSMQVLDKKMPGPDLVLDAKCKKCSRDFQHVLDWQYDSFFGSSSLLPEETS